MLTAPKSTASAKHGAYNNDKYAREHQFHRPPRCPAPAGGRRSCGERDADRAISAYKLGREQNQNERGIH